MKDTMAAIASAILEIILAPESLDRSANVERATSVADLKGGDDVGAPAVIGIGADSDINVGRTNWLPDCLGEYYAAYLSRSPGKLWQHRTRDGLRGPR
jgi:hypothetical protein